MIFGVVFFMTVFCLFLYSYEKAQKARLEAIQLNYRYKLFALRDKLRLYAIDSGVHKETWAFNYLDTSISKTIAALPRLSIWMVAYILLTYRIEPQHNQLLANELSKDENIKLRAIHNKFAITIGSFLVDRHRVLTASTRMLVWLLETAKADAWVNYLKKMWTSVRKRITESSQVSTLQQTCPI
ncbi:hypothetical protein MJD09_14590 [bacterium]|nr:hypothetical protein [bacterium]